MEDALGTRFVKKGEYIVLPAAPCSDDNDGEVGTENTAGQCGVGYYYPSFSSTRLGGGWSALNCRKCPFTGSHVDAVLYSGQDIYLSYGTFDGQTICLYEGGPASSVWYRTSGTVGCWIWSGATQHPYWNTTCPY